MHKNSLLPTGAPALRSIHFNGKGDRPLELAHRINVLAICVAFAFVGAVLLGMF